MNLIIGVAGFSGSGKSTFAKLLSQALDCPVISQDDFYIGRTAMMRRGMDGNNFDVPESLELNALKVLYCELKENGSYEGVIPNYDYISQSVVGEKNLKIEQHVVVDGNLIHTVDSLLTYVDFLIYVDVPAIVAKSRRLLRDTLYRGYAFDESEAYYTKYVIPSNSGIANLRSKADFLVDASGDEKSYLPQLRLVIEKIHFVSA